MLKVKRQIKGRGAVREGSASQMNEYHGTAT
jgi:hypothetical protein